MADINGLRKIVFDNREYYLGYKVVTDEMKSLGLRSNPNIIEYPINEWLYLPKDQLKNGKEDWGGIWVARDASNARNLTKYMEIKHDTNTRVFKALLDKVLYANSYRVKTNGVFLFEEITDRFRA
jgi:hypothetical protein